ncbi:hypothetical protein, partial [Rhizobium rhizogenes]|uniref:hypothetical protein n=1 Tax=Rhizobium rhizogenes TaxID=359 RepID=UPI001AEEE952
NLFVRETCALHSLVLSIGQSLLQNGLFQRGKVTLSLFKRSAACLNSFFGGAIMPQHKHYNCSAPAMSLDDFF